jgi:hypothetical protein
MSSRFGAPNSSRAIFGQHACAVSSSDLRTSAQVRWSISAAQRDLQLVQPLPTCLHHTYELHDWSDMIFTCVCLPFLLGCRYIDLMSSAVRDVQRNIEEILLDLNGAGAVQVVCWRAANVLEDLQGPPPPLGLGAPAPHISAGNRLQPNSAMSKVQRHRHSTAAWVARHRDAVNAAQRARRARHKLLAAGPTTDN